MKERKPLIGLAVVWCGRLTHISFLEAIIWKYKIVKEMSLSAENFSIKAAVLS